MSDVSKSLRSLTKNEPPWAIPSGRSEEMSDGERIAQVTHQKWGNEWIAQFFERIAHSLIFGQKMSDSLGKPMSEFPALRVATPSKNKKDSVLIEINLRMKKKHYLWLSILFLIYCIIKALLTKKCDGLTVYNLLKNLISYDVFL